jgi:hypothetical protein
MSDTPIENCEQLKDAVANHTEGDVAEERYLLKRAVELGCVNEIPDDWGVEVNG